MLSWIIKKNDRRERLPSHTPENTRIYAIGDIHGRYDLLQKIHKLIKDDSSNVDAHIRKIIIYIGDYIDRGFESKQVIDSFIDGQVEGFERIFIKGNHEHTMLEFLENPDIGEMWLAWGGQATIQSYGVNLNNGQGVRLNMEELSNAFSKAIPEPHLKFLQSLKTNHLEGDYLFVHAGIKPGVALEKQTDQDMMMIREEFIYSNNPSWDKTIVFGHTIFEEAFSGPDKIAIDTGAYATGKLTAVVLEGTSVKFIST